MKSLYAKSAVLILSFVIPAILNLPASAAGTTSSPEGMFVAGTTKFPAGDYKLINTKKGIEYNLVIDGKGTVTVQDVHASPIGAQPGAVPNPHAAPTTVPSGAAHPTASAAPVTTAVAVPATVATAAPAAPGALPPGTAAPKSNSSKVESLIRSQLQKQLSKNGGKIESEARKLIKF